MEYPTDTVLFETIVILLSVSERSVGTFEPRDRQAAVSGRDAFRFEQTPHPAARSAGATRAAQHLHHFRCVLLISFNETLSLQTRISDWKAGGLNTKYLLQQLRAADLDLQCYEAGAAPRGWTCDWDRYAHVVCLLATSSRQPP